MFANLFNMSNMLTILALVALCLLISTSEAKKRTKCKDHPTDGEPIWETWLRSRKRRDAGYSPCYRNIREQMDDLAEALGRSLRFVNPLLTTFRRSLYSQVAQRHEGLFRRETRGKTVENSGSEPKRSIADEANDPEMPILRIAKRYAREDGDNRKLIPLTSFAKPAQKGDAQEQAGTVPTLDDFTATERFQYMVCLQNCAQCALMFPQGVYRGKHCAHNCLTSRGKDSDLECTRLDYVNFGNR